MRLVSCNQQGWRKLSLEALEAWGKRAYRPPKPAPCGAQVGVHGPFSRAESVRQMNLGEIGRIQRNTLKALIVGLPAALLPQLAYAQEAEGAAEAVVEVGAEATASGYTPLGPEMIKGQPTDGAFGFQEQFSPTGHDALWMHDAVLMPVITVITLLVLALLLWVIVRYNKRANKVPSKTSHNTLIEILWTGIPIFILMAISVPSIRLLMDQYESPPENALTVKVTGYQWYWGYNYPDNGDFEVISNMLPEEEAEARGLPRQLAVDNRLVLPAGETIRIQTTGADVIHAISVPSLWFKIDAVPGRLNERTMFIEEPGIYYGQCSELCGARHGYMPIAIEALPRDQFDAWVLLQGGTSDAEVEEETPAVENSDDEETADEVPASDEAVPAA